MLGRVLSDIESERFEDVINTLDDDHERFIYLRHLELLTDCGYVLGVELTFTKAGYRLSTNCPRLSMSGYDFKDILQDRKLWQWIKQKAETNAVKLSWEFIKAAIPLAIKETLKS